MNTNHKHIFTFKLTENQRSQWMTMFDEYNNAKFTQHPDWPLLSQPNRKVNYFMLYANDGKLLAVSTIVENRIVANILWGPLCDSSELFVDSVEIIRKYYKRKNRFAVLRVTHPSVISSVTESLEYALYKRARFKQYINDKNLFSIAVNLEKSKDEILTSFKNSNKRGVKKGIKEGFEVREINDTSEVKKFASIFDEMIDARGIENQFLDTANSFCEILNSFQEKKYGKILAIYNKDNIMMGGIVILFKDDFAYYDIGASSPEFRKKPIMHSLFYKAMLLCKERGHKWFDLGGYSLISKDGDQVTNINKFKEGFAGVPQIYPKRMYFILNPWINGLYSLVMKIKG
ncbi:lipid II:glycine glycyltransferase FemX [Croceivirga thetidis]|uniref:Peptidoglycan bridge formation glycyltransferase FemA/FemB family protein n=1 Tax=Croceivirga thetidis TaxID=2721623 RepID=A0ABX1GR31_9FLAO|nr:peptidoglycan bridge formation glycyltransferase FemA/FemB family protein [Croceivirga thetidis]NKI32044.1 peptidoglycan bridge formation glycyltransferase FemA/FemB family protein [Croceivirga thetidis]